MNKYISRGLWGVLFVAGLSLLGAGAANAAETSGDDGTASGTQGVAAVTAPVNLGDNAISVVGDSSSSSPSGSSPSAPSPSAPTQAAPTTDSSATTSGGNSLVGGTQGVVDAVAPVEANGNAVSVLGDSSSSGSTPSDTAGTSSAGNESGAPTTNGQNSTGGGTQVMPSMFVPASASRNAVSVLGDSSSQGSGSSSSSSTTGTGTTGSGGPTTVGTGSVAGGSQLAPQFVLPIGASGNAVSVIGDSDSSGSTIPSGGTPGGGTGTVGTPAFPSTGIAGSGGTGLAGMSLASIGTLAFTGVEPAAALALLSALILAGLAMIGFAKLTRHTS